MDRKITAIFGFDQANVIWQPFCFGVKSSFFHWSPARPVSKCYQETLGGGPPTLHHFVFSSHHKQMIFCFFSPKFFSIWPILMADLLLHNFLHLLMHDAAQTDRPLILYSTKTATGAQPPK
jgi:hypothetical protein